MLGIPGWPCIRRSFKGQTEPPRSTNHWHLCIFNLQWIKKATKDGKEHNFSIHESIQPRHAAAQSVCCQAAGETKKEEIVSLSNLVSGRMQQNIRQKVSVCNCYFWMVETPVGEKPVMLGPRLLGYSHLDNQLLNTFAVRKPKDIKGWMDDLSDPQVWKLSNLEGAPKLWAITPAARRRNCSRRGSGGPWYGPTARWKNITGPWGSPKKCCLTESTGHV